MLIEATRTLYGSYGWLYAGQTTTVDMDTGKELIRSGYARQPSENKALTVPQVPAAKLAAPVAGPAENKAGKGKS